MNTVLPERASPVTPSRITGSKKVPLTVSVTASTLRNTLSAKVLMTKPAPSF